MGTPSETAFNIDANSDFSKRIVGHGGIYYQNDDIDGWFMQVRFGADYRPGGPWQFSLSPRYSRGVDTRQYVTTIAGGRPETFANRYIFAEIDQHTLSAQFRASYAFDKDLSLEAYVEPFAATGAYSNYGELLMPRETDLLIYGTNGTTITESTDDAPHLITVQDGADQFSFSREDFRALSFRSNVVLRWEWKPGSTLFFVWQLDKGGFGFETDPDSADFGDLSDSFSESGRSFFAVKATYWLPI